MGRLARVILGESLHFAAVTLAPLAGQEAQRTVTRSGELPMRLEEREKDLVGSNLHSGKKCRS